MSVRVCVCVCVCVCPCDIHVRAVRLVLTYLMLGSRRGEGSVTSLHIPKSVSSSLRQRSVILTFTMCSSLHLYNVPTHVPFIPFSCSIKQFHLTVPCSHISLLSSLFSQLTFPLVLSLFSPPPHPEDQSVEAVMQGLDQQYAPMHLVPMITKHGRLTGASSQRQEC